MQNNITKKQDYIEKLAMKISAYLNDSMKLDRLGLIKMKLGIEILLINLSKIVVVFVAAWIVGVFWETTTMLIVFALIRRNSFGLHSNSRMLCLLETLIVFVAGAWMCKDIQIGNASVCGLYFVISILLYRYAPADTEGHPLTGGNHRKQLRNNTMLTWNGIMIVTILVPSPSFRTLVLAAASLQTASVLPLSYKLLGRRSRNYEEYEKEADL